MIYVSLFAGCVFCYVWWITKKENETLQAEIWQCMDRNRELVKVRDNLIKRLKTIILVADGDRADSIPFAHHIGPDGLPVFPVGFRTPPTGNKQSTKE